MTTIPSDLKATAQKYADELKLATRQAKQLAALDADARKRVRDQIDRMLGEMEKETARP